MQTRKEIWAALDKVQDPQFMDSLREALEICNKEQIWDWYDGGHYPFNAPNIGVVHALQIWKVVELCASGAFFPEEHDK